MADLEELERLAREYEARIATWLGGYDDELSEARYQYHIAARPAAILALLEERKRLIRALQAAKGYMLNAKFDLEAGTKKATAMNTLEGGLKVVEAAIAAGEIKPGDGNG